MYRLEITTPEYPGIRLGTTVGDKPAFGDIINTTVKGSYQVTRVGKPYSRQSNKLKVIQVTANLVAAGAETARCLVLREKLLMDVNQAQYKDCFAKGYSDGFNNTSTYNAQMSHGNQDEIAAYHTGVEAGQRIAARATVTAR